MPSPLVFAAQQVNEGFLWLQIEAGREGLLTLLLTQGYITYAEVVWPALVAPALYLTEQDAQRKKMMACMIPYGIAVAVLLLGKMIVWPFHAEIIGHSLHYESGFMVSGPARLIYVLAIVSPLLVASRGILVVFGALVVFSFLITNLFYAHALISVWCFFAAALSVIIYLHSRQARRVQEEGLRPQSAGSSD